MNDHNLNRWSMILAIAIPLLGILTASYVGYAGYVNMKDYVNEQKASSAAYRKLADERHEEAIKYKVETEHRITYLEAVTDCLTGVRTCGSKL